MDKSIEEALASMDLPFTPAELQLVDALEIKVSGRYLLAYDVGSGKTFVSTLVALCWDKPVTLIVMPHILLNQWKKWLQKINQHDIGIFYGPKRSVNDLHHKWVLTSHNIFRDSYDDIAKEYRSTDLAVLLDEAQVIKNPKSVTFKCINKLVQPDRNLIMMTATPKSKLEDTYTYCKLKTPNLYRSWGHWQNLHVAEVDHFGAIKAYQNEELLAVNFNLKTVKRTKKELFGHTLEPIYQEYPYELDTKHYKLYTKLAEEQLLLLPDGSKVDATSAQLLRQKLQQIVCNHSNFSGNPDDKSKIYDVIDEVISETDPFDKSKSKLVIWCWYKLTSKALTMYLQSKYGKEAVALAYGGVDSAKGVDQIMNNDACRLAVFHPASVGAGLELQYVCSEVLFIEMSTSPIYTRQAIGRVDRPSQKVRPTIRFAQAQGTIQPKLFNDLLANDDAVSAVSTIQSLRDQIFGRG